MCSIPAGLDFDKPRYDTASLLGRFRNMRLITSPSTLLCTKDDLANAKVVPSFFFFVFVSKKNA
jgi:hypothetical protein